MGHVAGTDIFLSYARKDRGIARIFAECLADEGFSVWWDASLHSGETFDEVIERQLRDAGAVVVLWSPASVASRWVRAEATLADRRNKLAPAIIEPCDRPIIFELTHTAELCDWTGDITDSRWQTFMSDLRHLIDANRKHGDTPVEPMPAKRSDDLERRAHASGRQPLRPGAEDVIFAGRTASTGPAQQSFAPKAVPEESQHDIHYLELEEGDVAEQPIVIETSGAKIGRRPPADIVLSHKSISREHCIVGLANDELLVTDLNSTNGTFIDGVRIQHATVLPVGSVLKLGDISLKHSVRPNLLAEHGAERLPAGRLAAAS